MAAAVADFRPATVATGKLKKTHHDRPDGPDESAPTIDLVRNPDVLAGLVDARGRGLPPGHRGLRGRDRATRTGRCSTTPETSSPARAATCSWPTRSGAGLAFGTDANTVHLLFAAAPGAPADHVAGPASKREIAAAVWDGIQALLDPR